MYLDYWELREPPFLNVPSHEIFFESPQHQEAINRLLYVINHRKGVAMLTGEVGCGKTTVIRNLSSYLPSGRFEIRMLSNPAVSAVDLIRGILIQFGIPVKSTSKSVLLEELRRKLETYAAHNGGAVLVVDEAHVINSKSTLDELRMLLNLQADNRFLLTLIMVGQPLLLKKVEILQALKERISMKYHLPPLNEEDTNQYIQYRLKQAGSERAIFSGESIPLVYEYSHGVPLRINNLCDRCFLIGMMNKKQSVDAETVKQAVADLE
ncbi:MAG: AAA family ATPase [Thermodesulfobacteriota bacterium]